MKVAIFAGTNLRHKYFANKIIDNFDVAGLVAQQRDYDRERNVAGDIKLEYSGEDAELMDWHFSLKGNARIDRVMKCVLARRAPNLKVEPCFAVVVNDDGVYNSPGIDIPAVSISRSSGKDFFNHFPGYHTDLDNPESIDYNQMQETLEVLNSAIEIFEHDVIPIRRYIGVPHLSSAKLWVDWRANSELNKNIRYVLYEMDNESSVFDICARLGIDFESTLAFIRQMGEKNLVKLKRNNNW